MAARLARFLGAVLATVLLVSALATATMQAAAAAGAARDVDAQGSQRHPAPCSHAAAMDKEAARHGQADPESLDLARSSCIDACCPACTPLRVAFAKAPPEGGGIAGTGVAGPARALDPGLIDPPPRRAG